MDADQITGELILTPGRGGREVLVRDGARTYALSYRKTRNLLMDEYVGDGARLTVDPEVFFDPPDGARLGPCG